MAMTSAQKKAKQRQRDKLLGWREVTLRIPADQTEAVRAFVAGLPDPQPPRDPRQLDLIDRIEEELASGDGSPDQGSLF